MEIKANESSLEKKKNTLKFAEILDLMNRDYYARVNGRIRQVGWAEDQKNQQEDS